MPELLFALHIVMAQPAATLPPAKPPTAAAAEALRASADSAARAFLHEWADAWRQTQLKQASRATGAASIRRRLAVHCHWVETSELLRHSLIRSAYAAHASCPFWYPDGHPTLGDERRDIDNGVALEFREAIRDRRSALRALLDSVSIELPHELWLTRQRVRFALDAGALREARAIAEACSGDDAECALLRGLVLYRGGYVAEADSLFLSAAAAMPVLVRCTWNDLSMILAGNVRSEYLQQSCSDRARLETTLWWLADPLWLEAGNERRAEHFARRVHLSLLVPLGDDGRQHFTLRRGGDAVAETLVRYGWPSHMYWEGAAADSSHGLWLWQRGAARSPPYIAREYTRDRLHTLPKWSAVLDPFNAAAEAWQLHPPAGDEAWWPVEHFARDRSGIVQLPAGQSAMLLRGTGTRFAWAGDLDPIALQRDAGTSVLGVLFESRAPDDVRVAGNFRAQTGAALVVDRLLQPGPALVGIEITGDSLRPAARTRFAIDVAPTLTHLAGARALSQPLLFEPGESQSLAVADDEALRLMYGTTTFARTAALGVYWEGYGFAATDTVEIEVRAVREDRPGFLSRAATALRLKDGRAGEAGLRWRESSDGPRVVNVSTDVMPIQMRSIVLDISGFERGTYRLTVSMSAAGHGVVSSSRVLRVR